MEHVYANHTERLHGYQNHRRASMGGIGKFHYQNQDFFSTTINESSGEEFHNQNRPDRLSHNPSRAFSNFCFAHSHQTEPEFSSQSSREWDQDVLAQPNVFRKVSLKLINNYRICAKSTSIKDNTSSLGINIYFLFRIFSFYSFYTINNKWVILTNDMRDKFAIFYKSNF